MSEPVLTVNKLIARLQVGKHFYKVVDELSFKLYPGKTLALVGESGCGKTLTALSIMRIMASPPALPTEGEVIYKGKNLLSLSESQMRHIRGSRIAMIFQDPTSALNPVYTICEQLMEVAELHLNLSGEAAIERVVRSLSEVGIPSPHKRLHEYPHQLSGGMKQRVMIAMALMCKPDILIADEPTTALDVTIQAQVLDLIRSLQAFEHMALLLITHDMGVVAEMADDVIVMYASQAMESGNAFQIFDKMAHPYTMGLFRSRPTLASHRGQLPAIKGTVPPLTNYPMGCRFHPRCPFVMEKCKHGVVPDFVVNEQVEHVSKCWLYDGTAESAEKRGQQ